MKKLIFAFILGGLVTIFGSFAGFAMFLAWLIEKDPRIAELVKNFMGDLGASFSRALLYGEPTIVQGPMGASYTPYNDPKIPTGGLSRPRRFSDRHPSTDPSPNN